MTYIKIDIRLYLKGYNSDFVRKKRVPHIDIWRCRYRDNRTIF